MLRVGLTGGIGSGKSTAARRLVARGAVLVDADVLARAVVAPGTDGLAEVVAAFGPGVLGGDGALDRPALAAVVFADPRARARLNAIVHPRVRGRTEELLAAAAPDAIVVQDVPLLVETRSPADFALVVVVHADVEARVRRLVADRGMTADDARARIAAQAGDDARRAAADVWLDNTGPAAALESAVDALWHRRLVPFEANVRHRRPVLPPPGGRVAPDPGWGAAADRLAARVARAAEVPDGAVAPVGPTAVPGLPAVDVLDVALAVGPRADGAAVRAALDAAGFPRLEVGPDGAGADGWVHAGADPGRPVRVHGYPAGSPAWRAAVLRRDWLRADAAARAEYVRATTDGHGADRRWTQATITRMEDWAASSGWTTSLGGQGTGPAPG